MVTNRKVYILILGSDYQMAKKANERLGILHIEDDSDYRTFVEGCIRQLPNVEYLGFSDKESFLQHGREGRIALDSVVIVLLDRHLPETAGGHPNDDVWRELGGYARTLYPNANVLLLSRHPPSPREYKPRGVSEARCKGDFDCEQLKQWISVYLTLSRGYPNSNNSEGEE